MESDLLPLAVRERTLLTPGRPGAERPRPLLADGTDGRRQRPELPHPGEWPSVYGDLMSAKSATASQAASNSSSPSGPWPPGSRARTAFQFGSQPFETALAACVVAMRLGDVLGLDAKTLRVAGYHRGIAGQGLSPAARILAAADVYHAMIEPRPHRSRLTPDQAAAELHRLGASKPARLLQRHAVGRLEG